MSCPPFPSPEQEAEQAADALATGDVGAAFHHIAGALSADPLRPRFLEVCDRLFDALPDAVEATTPDGRPWFGNVALHARALARDGRHTEAIHLLLQIAATRPDVPYLTWAEAWLDAPATAVDPEALLPAIAHVLQRVPATEPGLRALVPVLDRLCASWDHPMLHWHRAVLLVRIADPRGPAVAEELFRRHPTLREHGGGLHG